MKKLSSLFFAAGLFFLTSCQTTREISINDNGGGTMVTTMDMSQLLGIAKMSGEADKMGDQKLDTTISFANMADSIPDATPADKELLKKGSMAMVMNMEEDKFLAKISFPFSDVTEITKLQQLSGKLMKESMKKQMSGKGQEGMPDDALPLPQAGFDDYFKTTYSKGLIEVRLDKEKYATVGADQGMQSLKEAMSQGLPFLNKVIIHLPKPAKSVEGANAKLSEDKKTLTVENDMSDFFEDATKLEYKVEF
ncbi:hypothetical protein LZZ85_20305 [Terrimonas sp. NA20]|uniref:Lipoprotein n=1 Tax=Terrimonas ginsenosidimutans TaxID=2908004 RepID=A0ABS9KWG6_9BACT|nr:hypothetical protein [Terrimonas ginsenosidimutans]MCG2616653.1 hypothetical protein [Terrimonas ginsenosidimutans]